MDGGIFIQGLFWLLALVGVCCLSAFLAVHLRAIMASCFQLVFSPLTIIRRRTGEYIQGLRSWLAKEFANERDTPEESSTYFVIGAFISTIFTVIFCLCDLGLTILTFEGLGLDAAKFELPIDTSTLAAGALIVTALFWGGVLSDSLGVTSLMPWRKKLSPRGLKILTWFSISMCALAVGIGLGLAYWRGEMIVDQLNGSFVGTAEASTEGFVPASEFPSPQDGLAGEDPENPEPGISMAEDESAGDDLNAEGSSRSAWVAIFAPMGIAALCIISTAFSMVGATMFLKYLIVALTAFCLGLFLLPCTFAAWLVAHIAEILFMVVTAVLDAVIHVGNRVLGIFGWMPENPGATEVAAVGPGAEAPPPENGPAPAGPEENGEMHYQAPADNAEDRNYNPFGL